MGEMLDEWPEPQRKGGARDAAARVEELKQLRPPEFHRGIRGEVAAERGIDPSTLSKLLRHPDGSPDSRRRVGPPAKPKWTCELMQQAIEAWWDRHGRPPTAMDWSPSIIKRRNRSTRDSRLAAFDEGWTDADGTQRPFPRADSMPFRRLVAEVAAARRGGTQRL